MEVTTVFLVYGETGILNVVNGEPFWTIDVPDVTTFETYDAAITYIKQHNLHYVYIACITTIKIPRLAR